MAISEKKRADNRRRYLENREQRIAYAKKYREEHIEVYKKRDAERYKNNPAGELKRRLVALYGLTIEQYDKMVADQDGKCAVCNLPPTCGRGKKLYVDHDHKTGRVRGLLCHHCNMILGYAKDRTDRLQDCITYLDEARRGTTDSE